MSNVETKEDVRQTKNKLTCLGRNNHFIGLHRHCYLLVHITYIYFASARLGCYNYTQEFSSVSAPSITFITGLIQTSLSASGAGNFS